MWNIYQPVIIYVMGYTLGNIVSSLDKSLVFWSWAHCLHSSLDQIIGFGWMLLATKAVFYNHTAPTEAYITAAYHHSTHEIKRCNTQPRKAALLDVIILVLYLYFLHLCTFCFLPSEMRQLYLSEFLILSPLRFFLMTFVGWYYSRTVYKNRNMLLTPKLCYVGVKIPYWIRKIEFIWFP